MKFDLNTPRPSVAGQRRSEGSRRAVALVITLLMLSVITFLAIAFLSMTSRDKTAVTASLDLDTAKTMSDAALARAQASAIAQMMSAGDILSYDLAVSHNYIRNGPYTSEGYYDPSDVNYDTMFTNTPPLGAQDAASNIENLFWDPRPPVYVQTNGSVSKPQYDFRFWVDINRNAGFETNGLVEQLDVNGNLIPGALPVFYQGEPEWIGVLKYPETNHAPNNPFIGRYAYMILPVGKTLDWNFIHNYSKSPGSRIFGASGTSAPQDNFIRDEGAGSWELNLAAFLNNLNTNMYTQPFASANYFYAPSDTGVNSGDCFNDAVQFIGYRYAGNQYTAYPLKINPALGTVVTTGDLNPIDEWGGYPSLVYPYDYNDGTFGTWNNYPRPWPGSYNTNMLYDVQDVFDTTKTSVGIVNPNNTFSARFANIMTNKDTYDRYTMQRMLACIGMGSQPEYATYVYSNSILVTNLDGNPLVPPPTSLLQPPLLLRTKVNIDFDNSSQIASGPYSPMPTNPLPWGSALNFFTNAADLLLRSQIFVYTNYVPITNGLAVSFVQSNYILTTFGITNIPVYNATNPGIIYNSQVHRMLQLAANIYTEANTVYTNFEPVPPVFRPQYYVTRGANGLPLTITITNFVQETAATEQAKVLQGYYDFTDPRIVAPPNVVGDSNYWGVPWVIGAVKGLPAFDQFSYQNRVFAFRRLNFVRKTISPGIYDTGLPQYTNQFFVLGLTNIFGLDAWNPYNEPYYGAGGSPYVYAYYDSVITITNNYNWGTNIGVTNLVTSLGQAGTNVGTYVGAWAAKAFKTFLVTNFSALPISYFSETANPRNFININAQGYLPTDLQQNFYPTYYWSVSVTNHCYYALFDGPGKANLVDFVNLGPFGSSFPLTQYLINYDQFSQRAFAEWTVAPATGQANNTKISGGVLNQILNLVSVSPTAYNSVLGKPGGLPKTQQSFDAAVPGAASGSQISSIPPYANYTDSNMWAACDPLVHYTLEDLAVPQLQGISNGISELPNPLATIPPLTLPLGQVTKRYTLGIANAANGYYILGDTSMTNSDAWNFPTNLFPSIGWIGRVHRGTPWQTVYLKPDDPVNALKWSNSIGQTPRWVNNPYTYPTTDYPILDLFTAVPNDNAARGLLSVNNTNDAAWAAVFSGVVVPSNSVVAGVINPSDVPFLMDSAGGINVQARTNYVNGNFRHIGEIAAAPVLSVSSPYLTSTSIKNLTDDVVERIPQQTLGLLKVGYPQFVIYSWGQALRPKAVYSGGPSELTGICTNYEITGEFLTRTICHVVSMDGTANAPQIVVDNYNIMPGN